MQILIVIKFVIVRGITDHHYTLSERLRQQLAITILLKHFQHHNMTSTPWFHNYKFVGIIVLIH